MPRTSTEQIPPEFAGLPNLFWSFKNVIAGDVLAENGTDFQLWVITGMDVVNEGAGTGATILIGSAVNAAGIFGAAIGAGQFDTFSWRGVYALPPGGFIQCLASTGGGWDSIGTGFIVPNVLF